MEQDNSVLIKLYHYGSKQCAAREALAYLKDTSVALKITIT